jgi:hypothetical protein
MKIDKLELSTETLRELTSDELADVAGGAQLTGTETMNCPTHGNTFAPCQPLITTNCAH